VCQYLYTDSISELCVESNYCLISVPCGSSCARMHVRNDTHTSRVTAGSSAKVTSLPACASMHMVTMVHGIHDTYLRMLFYLEEDALRNGSYQLDIVR